MLAIPAKLVPGASEAVIHSGAIRATRRGIAACTCISGEDVDRNRLRPAPLVTAAPLPLSPVPAGVMLKVSGPKKGAPGAVYLKEKGEPVLFTAKLDPLTVMPVTVPRRLHLPPPSNQPYPGCRCLHRGR